MSNETRGRPNRVDPRITMPAYDRLPQEARKAIRESVYDWDTRQLSWKWEFKKREYRDGPTIARTILRTEAKEVARDTTEKWGIPREWEQSYQRP